MPPLYNPTSTTSNSSAQKKTRHISARVRRRPPCPRTMKTRPPPRQITAAAKQNNNRLVKDMAEHLNGSLSSKAQPGGLLKYVPLALALLCIPLFLGLGAWQWQRAEAKSRQAAQPHSLHRQLPTRLPAADLEHYRLEGRLLRQWPLLLDNRTRNGRAGYELIVPFETVADVRLLVDLGWLPAPPRRTELPTPPLPAGPVTLEGQLRPLPRTPTLDRRPWGPGWPKRVQSLDPTQLATTTGLALPAALLRLERPLVPGLDTHWPPPRMTAERHQGYALQWLALALTSGVLAALYGRALYREHRHGPR